MNEVDLNLLDPYIVVSKNNEEADFTATSYLTFTNLSFDNTGMYVCRASNDLVSVQGTNSTSASLTVNRECFM